LPLSLLLRELLQLAACLPLMEAACLILFHPSAYVVLGVLPNNSPLPLLISAIATFAFRGG